MDGYLCLVPVQVLLLFLIYYYSCPTKNGVVVADCCSERQTVPKYLPRYLPAYLGTYIP